MRTKIIPFDLEMTEKIQAGEIKGRIVTSDGKEVKLFENNSEFKCFIHKEYDGIHVAYGCKEVLKMLNLFIELPEEALKHEFKPFDKVLVRDNPTQEWVCTLLSSVKDDGDSPIYLSICNYPWLECILYEGHEHLVGTTDNPKDD